MQAPAQSLTQTFNLQPGWNAIWLEVDPPDRTPAVVLGDLNFVSLWTWSERVSATDFIQNPSSSGWNRAQWLAAFPAQSPEAMLGNLHAILPRRAYLVKIAGTNAVDWHVTGTPSLQTTEWLPGRFHLRGLPVDPGAPPTFLGFFRPSPAHYDTRQATLEPAYRLKPSGEWVEIDPNAPVRRGEAYWIRARAPSNYQGPFSLEHTSGPGLEFGDAAPRGRLTVRNHSVLSQVIRFESATDLESPLALDHGSLATPRFTGFQTHEEGVAPGGVKHLRLLVDAVPGSFSTHTNIYRASDGQGTMYYLPVRIAASQQAGSGSTGGLTNGSLNTGLWMGSVVITNVAQAHATNATAAGTVSAGFPMRVLIHVDDHGQASLLREAALLYGRTTPDGQSNPAPFSLLVTQPARLARVLAANPASGRITGRRVSTSHFDFDTRSGQYELPLTGIFAIGNQLTGTIDLTPDLPGNPFLHRYHPDHGTNRAYPVSRDFTFRFEAAEIRTGNRTLPAIAGTYSETIMGLHKLPLMTSGSLYLQRISEVGTLNAEAPSAF